MGGAEWNKVSASPAPGMSPHRAGEFRALLAIETTTHFWAPPMGRVPRDQEENERWHHEVADRPGTVQAMACVTRAGSESLRSQKMRTILTDEELRPD